MTAYLKIYMNYLSEGDDYFKGIQNLGSKKNSLFP